MQPSSLPIPNDGSANVYDATSDLYVTDIQLDEKLVNQSPHHEIKLKRKNPKVVLDPLAPDYRTLFLDKGTVIAPDEILHETRPLALNIPLKLREDFPDPKALPDSDLLRAIHYYASSSRVPSHSMDETALLALGLLLEQWAEEEIDACSPLLFMEPDEELDLNEYAAPDLDINDDKSSSESLCEASSSEGSERSDTEKFSSRWSGEESDIMSIDLLESDTASEVEGGRQIKKKKISSVCSVPVASEKEDRRPSTSTSESSSDESTSSGYDSDTSSQSSDSDFGLEGFGSLKKSHQINSAQEELFFNIETLAPSSDAAQEDSDASVEKPASSAKLPPDFEDGYDDTSSDSSRSDINPRSMNVPHSDSDEPHFRQSGPVKPILGVVNSSESD